MPNEREKKGAALRRQGKPIPTKKQEGILTTKQEVRNRDDERIGWKRENEKRKRQAK